ncbi:MAG: hypothetical protein A2W00_02365 [Candidatus Eisenbacteria bacterium RBG_16_71_46]|nr:MAG: hypothetical protein A2W00_02365 [Candidatus Eisenbacteria bacterium RBG_16_71_46]
MIVAAFAPFASGALPAAIALLAAGLLLALDRRGRALGYALAPLAALLPFAAAVAAPGRGGPMWAALAVGLAVALLARDRDDLLHSECALKLVWVMVPALALSWAGLELLTLATGTPVVLEQWAVLDLGLDPPFLWSTALPLSLITGLVLLGAAPFHFWVADVFQGSRPWFAPLAVVALQLAGAGWILWRLGGVEAFAPAASLTGGLLGIAAGTAFVAGAATLLVQRRPERRVGTLASLHGALALAALAAAHGGRASVAPAGAGLAAWGAHLALALTGASTLARFLPVASGAASPGSALLRRHPAAGVVGLFALLSLAGVPGTPGARIWLDVARDLAVAGRSWALLTLAGAWLAAFAVAMQQLREAFGVPVVSPSLERPVPAPARAALWLAGAGLLALGVAWAGAARPS